MTSSVTSNNTSSKSSNGAANGVVGVNGVKNARISNASSSSHARIMISLESYNITSNKSDDKDDKYKTTNAMNPPLVSCFCTGLVFVMFLVVSEQIGRYILYEYRDYHPLLLNETNRYILARHIFVDALSCTICAILGYVSRYESFYPIVSRSGVPNTLSATHERLYTYMPNGFRLSLFFFWYQVKNLYDTIVWQDGPEYIFHHIFSLITAYGAMIPGCGHVYTIFFFGISEISTAILCILANFDDQHGVIGLGAAFPVTKIVCGAIFIVLFILCRCILWPIHSYYFCTDILRAFKNRRDNTTTTDPRTTERRSWMIFFLISLSGLSILQIAWLGQIFTLGKQELQALGFIK